MLQALRRLPARLSPAAGSATTTPLSPMPVFAGTTVRYALEWGVGLSLSLHAILLSIHFVMPDPDTFKHQDKGLQVVLVNSRHVQRPDKVDVLAQSNLDAGGTGDQSGQMATPLPPQEHSRVGDGLVEAQRRSEQQQAPEMQAMTGAKGKAIQLDAQQVSPTEAPSPVSGYDLLDSSAAVARIEAQIDKDLVDYAARPRKKFIGARAGEYRFAQYVEDWRQKIERVGTLNYPPAARGKMYGSLLLSISIGANGAVRHVEIQRSSGNKILDDAAVRIVQLASPFPAFPENIRKDTDEIVITRTWKFTNADMVKTENSE
ncbi:MAG: TonB family protein [Zoogloea sp.]|uniref:TonB family protein n=1 Tax=Zoogloea sp. TaxID=49181 RepID=UPI00260BB606|nr:TonB family protein [Zoogloea sp.]MDD2988511.1 TonB family protein [Zoogloea sp.]